MTELFVLFHANPRIGLRVKANHQHAIGRHRGQLSRILLQSIAYLFFCKKSKFQPTNLGSCDFLRMQGIWKSHQCYVRGHSVWRDYFLNALVSSTIYSVHNILWSSIITCDYRSRMHWPCVWCFMCHKETHTIGCLYANTGHAWPMDSIVGCIRTYVYTSTDRLDAIVRVYMMLNSWWSWQWEPMQLQELTFW